MTSKEKFTPLPDRTQLPNSIGEDYFHLLPDHTQLPCEDGSFVKNFQEHPQSILLTESIRPILDQLHPKSDYCIGQDSGIYWQITHPPERGAESPDWFYVPNVPATLDGQMRRSYVLWKELTPPQIALEFVSGNGSEERDDTPLFGKFWVYEQVIRPAYYGIYEVKKSSIEVYHLVNNNYQLLSANSRGHFEIPEMGVELGIWQGRYQNVELPWLRWWDRAGNLLPTGEEQAQQERERAEQERERAEEAERRATLLAAKLQELGIDPNEIQ